MRLYSGGKAVGGPRAQLCCLLQRSFWYHSPFPEHMSWELQGCPGRSDTTAITPEVPKFSAMGTVSSLGYPGVSLLLSMSEGLTCNVTGGQELKRCCQQPRAVPGWICGMMMMFLSCSPDASLMDPWYLPHCGGKLSPTGWQGCGQGVVGSPPGASAGSKGGY